MSINEDVVLHSNPERTVIGDTASDGFDRLVPYVAVGQLIAGLVLAVMLRSDAGEWVAGAWGALIALLYLLWLGISFSYGTKARTLQRWLWFNDIGALALGLMWGIGAGVVLFPATLYYDQTMLTLMLSLVAASALITHTATCRSGLVMVWAVLAPHAARYAIEGGRQGYTVALVLAIYAVLLSVVLSRVRRATLINTTLYDETDRLSRMVQTYEAQITHAHRVADIGSWEWDATRQTLHWSDELYALFGWNAERRITLPDVLGAIYWADRDGYEILGEEASKRGNVFNREFRIMRPDGTMRVLRDAGEVIRDRDGYPERVIGVVCDITERVNAEQKTKSAFRELNRILDNMQDTYYRADMAGRITLVSRSMERLLGYAPLSVSGMRIGELYANQRHGETFLMDLHSRGGTLLNYEIAMRHAEGRKVWVSANAQFIIDNRERAVGIEGTIRDISELKQAQIALHQEKERALVTLQSIGDGVITTDETGLVHYLNPTAEKLLGFNSGDAAGTHYLDVLRLIDEAAGESLGDLVRMCLNLDAGLVHADEGLLIQPDGTRYHLKVTAAPMRDHYGHVVGAVLVLHDLTEVMGMARQLSYQASHDILTGLSNRRVFERRVEEALRDVQSGGEGYVLFYMDLDQFKVVNDTCGHKAGDELLQQIAQLMQGRIRDSDVLARLGGDEFGVLLVHCPLQKAQKIAEGLRAAIRDFRFVWDDKAFEIGVSIGVVPLTPDSGNLVDVLAAADAACYVAKDSGRNRLHVYQPDDDAVRQRHGQMEWVHRLSSAFEDDRFVLYAQAVAHVSGDRVVSHYEVLLRMVDERARIIPPGAFIPAAERYNLMPTIDRWVIRETLEMLRVAQGTLAFPPIECAINLSGQSLCDEHFLEYVVDQFDASGIPCESVCFEITETAAVANLSKATRFITVLKGMGCSFALDDFGAGLSSFGYLKSLPVDYLKIDGGFVRDMVVDRVDRAMVESINQIGHVLKLKTIGEFVEDEAILAELERAGVDFAQGSAIAPPRPLREVLDNEMRMLRRAVPDWG